MGLVACCAIGACSAVNTRHTKPMYKKTVSCRASHIYLLRETGHELNNNNKVQD